MDILICGASYIGPNLALNEEYVCAIPKIKLGKTPKMG